MGSTYVNPQAYYDAAKKLTDIGTSIDAATTALVKTLWDTGSMAGTSDAATKWAISYDTRAGDAVTSARKLAQTLPYFASLVALAGYNHDLADYNADIKPTRAAPSKPAVALAPGPLDWATAPASGGPGDGIRAVHALMDRIHVDIPDGNTDKLAAAAKAWLDFMYAKGFDQAGQGITNVLGALEQDNTALEPGLTDQLTTLSVAADKVWAAAEQLSNDCADHKDPLDDLRDRIKRAIDQLEISTGIALAATIFADVITAGVGLVLDAVTAAAEAKFFDLAAETITDAVQSVGVDQILSASAQEVDALGNTSRNIDEVASLTPEEIDEEASSSTASQATSPSGTPTSTAVPRGRPTTVSANEAPENQQALTRENESAQILARAGYNVEQNPTVAGIKNPDYMIEGKVFDNVAPTTGSPRNIASRIEEKVQSGQTDRVVVNLGDSSASADKIKQQLQEWPISGLQEVKVIDQQGNVIEVYP